MDSYDDDHHHHHECHRDFDLMEYLHLLNHHHPHEEEGSLSTTITTTTTSNNFSHQSDQSDQVLQLESISRVGTSLNSSITPNLLPRNNYMKYKGGVKRVEMDLGSRIAFRTKSVMEIMDDGFKWTKYGKKMVKSNPNPRNYYKCATKGCKVKKLVERDGDDSSYVITTYDGIHNHESPSSSIYSNNEFPSPMAFPGGWTFQASPSSS